MHREGGGCRDERSQKEGGDASQLEPLKMLPFAAGLTSDAPDALPDAPHSIVSTSFETVKPRSSGFVW